MAAESLPPVASSPVPDRSGALPPAGYLLVAGITLFWGANWPMMKIALGELPVWSFRSFCLVGGGTGLLLAALLGRHSLRVPRREIGPLLLCALFNVVGWHLFSAYGLSMIAAGRATIIAFTMPLWATLFASLLLGEALTARKLVGLALGLAGLGILVGPDLQTIGAAPLGAMLMLGAAISWSIGTVLFKRFAWSAPVVVLAGWQIVAGALPVVAGALLIDDLPDLDTLSTQALLALAYVIALPMVFCQWAYFKLVRIFPASLAAIGTLAIPVVGVFSSAWILGESIGAQEVTSLFLVCSALAVVLVLPRVGFRGRA